jgi:molybdenum cofactor guanylyltransferase
MAIDAQLGLIILAGGLGTRVGGANKALLPLHGRPLLTHIMHQLGHCSDHIIISANRDITQIQSYGYPVCQDLPAYTQMGPLAGIISAAQALPEHIEYLQIVPCDLPLLNADIITSLYEKLHNQPELDIVCAADTSNLHPIVCQMRRRHLHHIQQQLNSSGKHSVRSIIQPYRHAIVTFADSAPFTNYNSSAMFTSTRSGATTS